MNCMYCSASTQVINSRPQKRLNHIWRRRKCAGCGSVFTTTEAPDLLQAVMVRRSGALEPFQRDYLFISLYDSLRHRQDAATDATALTATVISKLLEQTQGAVLERHTIVQTAHAVLSRFDHAAATHYAAYHPL